MTSGNETLASVARRVDTHGAWNEGLDAAPIKGEAALLADGWLVTEDGAFSIKVLAADDTGTPGNPSIAAMVMMDDDDHPWEGVVFDLPLPATATVALAEAILAAIPVRMTPEALEALGFQRL